MPADSILRLIKLSGIQSESMRLLFEADRLKKEGDLAIAETAYDRLIEVLKLQLAETKSINAEFPTGVPIDVVPVVNPLLDALVIQADLHEAQGRRDEAGRLREEATGLAQEYLSDAGIAERQRQLAGSLLTQGRFHEGLMALAAARDLFARKGQFVSAAEAGADLAGFFEWLGDKERALAEAERAHRLVADKLVGGPPDISDVLTAFAAASEHFGRPAETDSFSAALRQAQENAALLKVSVEIDQIRARIGRRAGRYEEAEQLFDRVYPHIPAVAQPAIRWQIAALRIQQGRFQEALDMLAELEPVFTGGLLRQKLPVLLRSKAEALLGLNRGEEALPEIDHAIAALEEFFDPDALWNLRWIRAQILERLGRPADALEAILAAAATVDELRRAPLGWRLDSTFLSDKLPMFRAGIRLAVEASDAEVCCQLIEKVKARALAAVLNAPEQGPPMASSLESTETKRVDKISVELDVLDYAAHMEGWTVERRQRRQELLDERTALLEHLRIADPRWRALTAPVPLDLPRIQELLAARKQAVLDLFYQPERIVAVLLTGDALRVESHELSAPVQRGIERYLGNFSATPVDARLFDPSALDLGAEELMPAALVEAALHAQCLVVIPHGPLHLLPWAGLTWRGRRLFEHLPVSVLPNLTCLTALDGELAGRPRAAILGAPDYSRWDLPPLDGAREELLTVEEIYNGAAGLVGEPRTGAGAREAAFWELANAPYAAGAILHLACHASFENDEPQHSGLQLTDGTLDAAEISRGRLPFAEVILSACNTGQRALKVRSVELVGDDILGLPGAFIEAGVRSVLVSIPLASDSAALYFMTRYHEERSAGATPVRAFQIVQVEMLSRALYPIDTWIGFTLYGAQ